MTSREGHKSREARKAREAKRAAALATTRIRFAEDLPVTQRRHEIAEAIAAHQVVIVAGETGSGKTTQIPKICLELGRGVTGTIGHTQPRRLAARTVAERIAAELDTTLGAAVGYKVRFTDQVSDSTLIKVMTDGILLAEIARDRKLRSYDTLIIDEAHERSLNIDFLLGYVKDLLPRRPDLKVIITSATIDTARFSAHFDGAPVVEVTGRSYPVEVRYRPLAEDDSDTSRDQTQAVIEAVAELSEEGPGDILVFLSGEREIRDTADALAQAMPATTGAVPLEILPLYARLSVAEQRRVFQDHPGRRVVLATNVAETSLTVPGIRYVVDPGTARISRYSRRTKVQRLPIEDISQASANQRAGRCGRVAPGICIRLYAEEDFEARPPFTDPEILRTNLASVILAMTAIGLGDIAAFPFVEPPDHRAIADGIALLHELGALDGGLSSADLRLTPVGTKLARLPVDPRLGRMVIEAERYGALREVTVIAAALSIQDPRLRPAEHAAAAAEAHARFADPDSDFLSLVNLWTYLTQAQRERSGNQFRKLCRAEFLNYLRVREWQDIAAQIRHVLRDQHLRISREPALPDAIHRSVLAGLLSQIGVREGDAKDFAGARQARFVIAPGSVLARKPPRWVMAAELVETNRLWARTAARINPDWVEAAAGHLVKRSYGDPAWDPGGRGSASVIERVTLYGVAVVTGRKVPYGRVDSADARDLFIDRALVDGDWDGAPELVEANRALLNEVRARKRSIAGTDETNLFDFYDRHLPAEVVSGRHFETWWRRARSKDPDLLTLTPESVLGPEAGALDPAGFPGRWRHGDLDLAVSYSWEPGEPHDGVTVAVPLDALAGIDPDGFDWQVPGLRHDLVVGLIRTLPKVLRRHVVPAPTYAQAFLDAAGPDDGPLTDVLAAVLAKMTGEPITVSSFSLAAVPAHLRVHFVVTDRQGRPLASGNDLGALRSSLDARLRRVVIAGASDLARRGITTWDFGELPATVSRSWSGHVVSGWVALVDHRTSVAIAVLDDPAAADRAMWAGTRRLLMMNLPASTGPVIRTLRAPQGPGRDRATSALALLQVPGGDVDALAADCVTAAVDRLLAVHGGPVRDAAAFEALRVAVRSDMAGTASEIAGDVGEILVAAAAVAAALAPLSGTGATLGPSLGDVRRQVAGLVRPGFVTDAGAARLPDIARYLRGAERRLATLAADPARDQQRMLTVLRLAAQARALPDGGAGAGIAWMIEELRVSLWAQGLGTSGPVSEARIRRAMT